MIALLVIVASAAIFVVAVTKILDVQLKEDAGPSPVPTEAPALVDEAPPPRPLDQAEDEAESVLTEEALAEEALAEEAQEDDASIYHETPESLSTVERAPTRLGASSRLLVTVVAMGAALSIAIVLLVGWLGKLIAAALS